MSELTTEKLFLSMLMLGVVLMLLFLLTAWLSHMVRKAWLWVDDAKTDAPYPMTLLIAKVWGYKHTGANQFYKGCKSKDSWDLLGAVAALMWLGPVIVYVSFKFYPVVLAAGLLYAIAHTARFARRHKKLFDKHVKDPEAHK